MRPAQFTTQCVANWKQLIEDPHMAKVRNVESAPELLAEGARQKRQEPGAVHGPYGSPLLKLHDVAANLPAGLYLDDIDRPKRLLARSLDQRAKCGQQILSVLSASRRLSSLPVIPLPS